MSAARNSIRNATGSNARRFAAPALALLTLAVMYAPLAAQPPRPGGPQRNPLPLRSARTAEFTATEGTWISLDVSPDGRTIVFDLLGDLYTMPITGGKASPLLTGMAFETQPRFRRSSRTGAAATTCGPCGWTGPTRPRCRAATTISSCRPNGRPTASLS